MVNRNSTAAPKQQPRSIMAAALMSLAILATLAPALTAADVGDEKNYLNPDADRTCPVGEALAYTILCDPGTRSPVDRIWLPQGAGVEICKVSQAACAPVPYPSSTARPGHEAMDSHWGQPAAVIFGLDRLLGK